MQISRERFRGELVDRIAELLATGQTEIGPAVVTMEAPTREIDLDRLAPDQGLLNMLAWADRNGLPVDVWHGHRRVARIEPERS